MSNMDVKTAFDNLRDELERMLDELNQQGSDLFQHSQYDEVNKLGDRCKELQRFIDQVQKMVIAWSKYDVLYNLQTIPVSKAEGSIIQSTNVPNQFLKGDSSSISSRPALGRKRREIFLKNLREKGIVLTQEKGSTFHTVRGQKVVIASALEKNSTWWMGTPMKQYDYVVLLCQEENDNLLGFVFDAPFLVRVVEKLGHNYIDYSMYHIKRDGGSYILQLNGGEREIIDRYLSAYDCLR
jgi:hypothetical protein